MSSQVKKIFFKLVQKTFTKLDYGGIVFVGILRFFFLSLSLLLLLLYHFVLFGNILRLELTIFSFTYLKALRKKAITN